jgi:predicted N-acetyltransferase YhbS
VTVSPTSFVRAFVPHDLAEIDALNDLAFGPGRFAKTAHRLREGVEPDADLSLVAMFGDRLGGSVTMTPIRIGPDPALLLGPLAVHPDFERRGVGSTLVRTALDLAATAGHSLILLVGDEAYYGSFGFRRVDPTRIRLPGPADPRRVLMAELAAGAFARAEGPVKNVRWA